MMHFLDRTTVAEPECLVSPPEGLKYGDLGKRDKDQIRAALLELQRHRCAYCERRTGEQRDDGHIEHFQDQSGHTDQTLNWTNLFWSCNYEHTCGKHKDKCRKNEGTKREVKDGDLIDPSAEDPEEYLFFVSDGAVKPRDALDARKEYRAKETIRAFQLDSPFLTRSRQDAIRPYLSFCEMLLSFGPENFVDFLRSELQKSSDAPFSTAIKHFLTSLHP